jgi:aminoglycoside/choline kinase family phosphotransferase
MTKNQSIIELSALFEAVFGVKPEYVIQLPLSGSDRVYYRLQSGDRTAIGAYNADITENEAFFSFTETFKSNGLKVPALLKVAPNRMHYLVEDLGNETLFHRISNSGKSESGKAFLCLIKESLYELINVQLLGGEKIDFSKCYPRQAFDRQSILWDLNYFKYEFLKLASVPFNEQALEDDFNTLSDYLLTAPSDYFMFRDFQSRNIMLVNDKPWFIDYQGGRRGPLQYDLASLLYSPKTGLNAIQREALLEFYLSKLEGRINVDRTAFTQFYYGFVLIRILQALGAYGFRGLYEQKPNFRSSIPEAIANLNSLLENQLVLPNLPEIKAIANRLALSKWAKKEEIPSEGLTIRITSFSYKKGIPFDPSENGGGFVFDCRGLPNPGRYEEYRSYSGHDKKVTDYLEQFSEVEEFQDNVRKVVKTSIDNYLKRGFNHLCINFGCTGGQHRSVYNAEKFAVWVQNNYAVNVVLIHTEKENWKRNE